VRSAPTKGVTGLKGAPTPLRWYSPPETPGTGAHGGPSVRRPAQADGANRGAGGAPATSHLWGSFPNRLLPSRPAGGGWYQAARPCGHHRVEFDPDFFGLSRSGPPAPFALKRRSVPIGAVTISVTVGGDPAAHRTEAHGRALRFDRLVTDFARTVSPFGRSGFWACLHSDDGDQSIRSRDTSALGHQYHSQHPGAPRFAPERTFKARRRAEMTRTGGRLLIAVHLPTGTAAGHDLW